MKPRLLLLTFFRTLSVIAAAGLLMISTAQADTIQINFTATLDSEWDSDFIDWISSDTISGYLTYDTDTEADYESEDYVSFSFSDSSAILYLEELDLSFNVDYWDSENMEGTTSYNIYASDTTSDSAYSLYLSLYSSTLLEDLSSLPDASKISGTSIGSLYLEDNAGNGYDAWPNFTEWETTSDGPDYSDLPAPVLNDDGEVLLGGDGNNSGARIDDGDELTTTQTIVGYGDNSEGIFVQAGGTHTAEDLILAESDWNNAQGTYILSGGELITDSTEIGKNGTGIFTQTGGTHTTDWLMLGNSCISSSGKPKYLSYGTYNLSSGTLEARTAIIGGSGQGTFNQSGGTVTIGPSYNRDYMYSSTSTLTYLNIGTDISETDLDDYDLSDEQTPYGIYNLTGGELKVYSSVAVGGGTDSSSYSYGGKGYFNQSGGTSTMYNLIVGEAGSTGSGEGHVSVSGDAQMNIKNDILVGVASTEAPAKATFIQTGGTVLVDETIQIGESGEDEEANAYRVQGGQTTATNGVYVGTEGASTGQALLEVSNGGILDADVTIYSQGILKGDGGTITGNVFVDGGTLAPGNSPGTMTIDGNLELLSGTLELEVGLDESDVLSVTGNLTIGSDLTILLLIDTVSDYFDSDSDNYLFDLDDFFDVGGLFTLAQDFSIENSLIIDGLTESSNVTVSFQGSEIAYTYSTSSVPVPSAFLLFASGLIGLVAIKRK